MESITEEIQQTPEKTTNFFKYVFDFNNDNKNKILNMLQYTILAIIPVYLTLKGIKHSIPEEDESKGCLEISIECILQIVLIVLAIWFIDRIVRYIPTYSNTEYAPFNPITFLVPFLILLTTMQTKLGEKFNIMFDRLMSYIGNRDVMNGNSNNHMRGNGNNVTHGNSNNNGGGSPPNNHQNMVRVTQPLSGSHQASRANNPDRNQLLPSNNSLTSMPNLEERQQQMPHQMSEPLASNEPAGFGGSAW